MVQLWEVFICVLWSAQFHVQGWVRSTGLSSLRDLGAVALALPCSTRPSQWAKQDLWFHSAWGFLGHMGIDGWMDSLPVKPPWHSPVSLPSRWAVGNPRFAGFGWQRGGVEGSAQVGVGRAEHSSRCWLPISLNPSAEPSGALGLAVLGMSMCHRICVRQRVRTQVWFLPCFESLFKCQATSEISICSCRFFQVLYQGSCCELRCGVRSVTGVLVSGEEHQVAPIVLRMLRMLEPRQLLLLLVQDVNSHSVPQWQGLGAGAEPRHKAPRCFFSCQVTHLPRSICRAHLTFVLCPLMEGAVKHICYMHLLISHAMPGPGSSTGWRILNSCMMPGVFVLRCL